ncbi:hypothetical protein DIPPA_15760 [Diplonema papillatum]|nr:hypothetical protein DIPPA_07453 [Diplonema papillatum]KAJ9449892.1 hypothetical protein DIPPA_15760 [Diplonema papillatum]
MTEGRKKDLETLFPQWDLDGSGYIEFMELQQVLESSERLEGKRAKKVAARLKARLIKNGKVKPLSIDQFVEYLSELMQHVPDNEWPENMDALRAGLTEAQSLTASDRHKRVQWSLFRLLDLNQDGFVDFQEIVSLFGMGSPDQTKAQRKLAARWGAAMKQKNLDYLRLPEFHQLCDDLFKGQTEDEYIETMVSIEAQLGKTNNAVLPVSLGSFGSLYSLLPSMNRAGGH